MRRFLILLLVTLVGMLTGVAVAQRAVDTQPGAQAGRQAGADRPNVIIVLADDLGYGDLASYGHPSIRTPHLDAMAREGFRAGAAYAPSPSCSPTRAALMTGRYAHRVGILSPLSPRSPRGLKASDYVTLPQVLRAQGYKTMLVGKWHLGDQPGTRPMDHAFDRFVGMLYSHDYKDPWVQTDEMLSLWDGERRAEDDPDASTLTARYTREALSFIRGSAAEKRPFFLYLAHAMPHVPLAVSAPFQGASRAALYGDVVAELDDSMGQIRRTLAEVGQERQTLVIFTSDNGPWNVMPDRMFGRDIVKPWDHGTTGPFRGGKAGTYEGGHRVPFIAAWPGRIPAGQFSDEPISLIDLLPTAAGLAGAASSVPADIDGRDIWPLLSGASPAMADRPLLYDHLGRAEAVRLGPWKLRVTRVPAAPGASGAQGGAGAAGTATSAAEQELVELFHLVRDPGERYNMAEREPALVAKLRQYLAPRP